MYAIGDKVWKSTFQSTKNYVECPDCGGTGRLRVTFHDDTQVSIDCKNCSVGYDPPSGRVMVYERHSHSEQGIIVGIEITSDGVEYKLSNPRAGSGTYWCIKESEIFNTKEEADAYGVILAEEANKEELARVYRKEKDTRTWAWNASYHRRCIKDAEKQIVYHTAKLNVASLKAKEDKKS